MIRNKKGRRAIIRININLLDEGSTDKHLPVAVDQQQRDQRDSDHQFDKD